MTTRTGLPRRLAVGASALLCLGAAPGAFSPAAGAAPAGRTFSQAARLPIRVVSSTGKVRLARGVTLWRQTLADGRQSDQVTLLGVDLGVRGVSIQAASPDGMVGAERATVRSQTNEVHALAGVNADFFDLDNDQAEPRGVFVRSGRLVKSPKSWRNANFYVTPSGKANIGPLSFDGSVVRRRSGVPASRQSLYSINSLYDAQHGRLTFVTDQLGTTDLPRSCAVATGRTVKGARSVTSVRPNTWTIPALTSSTWALVSCGDGPATWVRRLRRGDAVTMTDGIAGATPRTAVSGGSVLVKNGRAHRDPAGEQLPYTGDNAETFGCVRADHLHVVLGTIDGYTRRSAGVTYARLTDYLLALKCYSGIVFDGGGSATLVARLPGTAKAVVQNVPAERPARAVADSLVVFSG